MASEPIKLSTTSNALMALLAYLGEGTSYDIKQALEKSIENFWNVPHTTAYEEPARLAEGGYLSVKQESGGRRRKSYALTEKGRKALRSWADDPVAAPPALPGRSPRRAWPGTARSWRSSAGTWGPFARWRGTRHPSERC
jgi:DNA-binding PadR family transcriptional regulator